MQRSIYKTFLEAMVERAKTISVGPPLDRGTKMGALISREQFDRVRMYQELGKTEAKVALGGGAATVASLANGYFVQPTIFYDVDNAARIAREEIFGPVASVIPFDDEDEVGVKNRAQRPAAREDLESRVQYHGEEDALSKDRAVADGESSPRCKDGDTGQHACLRHDLERHGHNLENAFLRNPDFAPGDGRRAADPEIQHLELGDAVAESLFNPSRQTTPGRVLSEVRPCAGWQFSSLALQC